VVTSRALLLASALVFAIGCGADEPEPTGPLLLFEWSVAGDLGVDPFPSHQPAELLGCTSTHALMGPSGDVLGFEVETGQCPYFLGLQPVLRSARAGEQIQIEFWHDNLFTDGVGHLALAAGGRTLWEFSVEMPRGGTRYTEVFELEEDIEEGEEAVFHLHNHGANYWVIKTVSVLAD
jgi:hypothetical protein